MPISMQAIIDLESDINDILEQDCTEVRFTFHASYDRMNDPRNNPLITINELEDIFKQFIKLHLKTVIGLKDGDSFVIRCNQSNINLPCAVFHDLRYGKKWIIQSVITMMRKVNFKSKNGVFFDVN